MPNEKSPPRHDWRSHLTPRERKEAEKLESIVQKAREASSAATKRLSPIRNRCIQRAARVEKSALHSAG